MQSTDTAQAGQASVLRYTLFSWIRAQHGTDQLYNLTRCNNFPGFGLSPYSDMKDTLFLILYIIAGFIVIL